MMKRLFATLICAMLLLPLLPKTAFAANATSVWIAGVKLDADAPHYHNGAHIDAQVSANTDEEGANATFDPSVTPPTLTLNGLDVKDSTATHGTTTYAIYADGDLKIVVNANSDVSTSDATSANFAVDITGNVTFEGPSNLAATAGNGSIAAGVHIGGDLKVISGTLRGVVDGTGNRSKSCGVNATGSITVAGGELIGNDSETGSVVESYGVYTTASLTVNGGKLLGNSGAVAAAGAVTSGISAGVSAIGVTVSGGSLIGTGNAATASYALSYGLFVSSLTMTGGIITANGKAATGSGDRAFSAGIAANGVVSVSGGKLTAQGGQAEDNTGAGAQSSGIYAGAESISFSGGTVNATGGGGNNSCGIMNAGLFDPYGVYSSGGAVSVSGTAAVTAKGGEASSMSYGLHCRGTGLAVSGGTFTAASESGSTRRGVYAGDSSSTITVSGGTFTAYAGTVSGLALNKALAPGDNITAKGSTSVEGSSPQPYAAANNADYKWVSARPTVASVQVNPSSVSIQRGGTQNFNATVMGENPAQTVSWAVEGGVTGTRIESNGDLTIATDETAATLTVRATSTVNSAVSGTSTVTVTEPDPIIHRIIQGQNGKWTEGGTGGLGFTADGDYNAFRGVSVDGTTLSSGDYTSGSGSTIVVLNAAYLETLSIGRHTLRINFTDGYAETRFTTGRYTAVPATGDDSQPVLWLGLALLACAGIAVRVVSRRKRQNG